MREQITNALKLLKEGSLESTDDRASRSVCRFLDKYVLKVPHGCDSKSVMELQVWGDCPSYLRHLLVPVVASFYLDDKLVLVMERVETVEERLSINSRFMGFSTQIRESIVEKCGFIEWIMHELGLAAEIDTWTADVEKLAKLCDLSLANIFWSPENLGIKNGKLVILDYGYVETVDYPERIVDFQKKNAI